MGAGGDQPSEWGTRLSGYMKPGQGGIHSLSGVATAAALLPLSEFLTYHPPVPYCTRSNLSKLQILLGAFLHKSATNPTSPAGEGPGATAYHSSGPSVPSNLTSPWSLLCFCSKHITILLGGHHLHLGSAQNTLTFLL